MLDDRLTLATEGKISPSQEVKDKCYEKEVIEASLEQYDAENGKDKVWAKIKKFKTYVKRMICGERLCGIRCYDKEDDVVLQAGWFDPQFLTCKKHELKDGEKIVGIESDRHRAEKGVHYNVKF